MNINALVIIPPLLVLAIAFIRKEIMTALVCGIISAAFIGSSFSIAGSFTLIASYIWNQFDYANLCLFLFLIFLGTLITIMNHTGATHAYAVFIRNKLHSRRQTQGASIILSFLFSIDDFFSIITTGSIMRPLTDHFRIPRAKLAFLIDSLAAPVVLLIPYSSWIPMLSKQLSISGISNVISKNPLILSDPFTTYIHTIPFVLYSFVTIISTIFIVCWPVSFGMMKQHEEIAHTTGNLFGGKNPIKIPVAHQTKTGGIADFLFPIVLLISTVFLLLLFTGNWQLLRGTHSLLQAFHHADIFLSLCLASIITVLITSAFFIIQGKIELKNMPFYTKEGIEIMKTSIIVLILAWTFSSLLRDELHTGTYLANKLLASLPAQLLPFMFFITSAIASIAIGSSWGTIAIMIPLAIPMIVTFLGMPTPVEVNQVPLLFPLLGSIFSGAVAGDHVSPISSTTLMASTSAEAYHEDHVQTQMQYAAPALFSCALGFLMAGILKDFSFWLNVSTSLSISSVSCILLLCILSYRSKRS